MPIAWPGFVVPGYGVMLVPRESISSFFYLSLSLLRSVSMVRSECEEATV